MTISVTINTEKSFPAESAFATIGSQVFRVETRWENIVRVGTAFAIARLSKSNRLVLATAAHVLSFPEDAQVEWKVQTIGQGGAIDREVTFRTNELDYENRGYHYNKKLDIGTVVLPAHRADGKGFAHAGENGLVSVHDHEGVTTATRVGWAGYPAQVEDYLGFPHLCYFEGVVSAVVDSQSCCLYVVDGHLAPGVSGGPVWHWSEDRNQVEVIGIVSSYTFSERVMPGFCVFEPINPLILYVQSWNKSQGDRS